MTEQTPKTNRWVHFRAWLSRQARGHRKDTIAPPLGTQPRLGGQPPFKPEVRCYTNPVPDVNGPLGEVGPASPSPEGVNP